MDIFSLLCIYTIQNMFWHPRSLYDIKEGVYWVFCCVKVLPSSCLPGVFKPLMRPFIWGTVWVCILSGTSNTSCQIWGVLLKDITLTSGISKASWDTNSHSTSYERCHLRWKYIYGGQEQGSTLLSKKLIWKHLILHFTHIFSTALRMTAMKVMDLTTLEFLINVTPK